MQSQSIELNSFQQRALAVPDEYDLMAGGGRGGGKSYLLALIALRHIEQYGAKARVLFVRQSYKGLADFELLTRELFGKIYGNAARFNAADHVWRFPNGGYLELGQIETFADINKYQGRSFTLLLCDEAGQYASPDMLDLLRSNLRGPKDVPVRVCIGANPGGAGHQWLASRYVFKADPWTPFFEAKSKRNFVYAPSTFVGNQFIDTDAYKDQLESACASDPELLKAWVHGDWAVSKGAFFANVIDESRNAIEPWTEIPKVWGTPWETYLAHDWGSSAPSVTQVFAQSPGATVNGKFYPRDSLVIVDELATNKRDRLNEGLQYTVPILSEMIVEMCKRWKIRPVGVADDACFSNHGYGTGSIADEFHRAGVHFTAAKKADRLTGWATMRRLLADAGKPDVPGLYVSRACEYWWATIPYVGRDERRIEDVNSREADHAADATRYGCLRLRHGMKLAKLVGV